MTDELTDAQLASIERRCSGYERSSDGELVSLLVAALRSERTQRREDDERWQEWSNSIADRMPEHYDGDDAQEAIIDRWLDDTAAELERERTQNARLKTWVEEAASALRAATTINERMLRTGRVEALHLSNQERLVREAEVWNPLRAALSSPPKATGLEPWLFCSCDEPEFEQRMNTDYCHACGKERADLAGNEQDTTQEAPKA